MYDIDTGITSPDGYTLLPDTSAQNAVLQAGQYVVYQSGKPVVVTASPQVVNQAVLGSAYPVVNQAVLRSAHPVVRSEVLEAGTPYVLTSTALAEGAAPLYTNPAAALYSSGDRNQVLLSSNTAQCDTGCLVNTTKPDPRVFQVKPLYQPYVYKAAPGQQLPTAYNVVGMY